MTTSHHNGSTLETVPLTAVEDPGVDVRPSLRRSIEQLGQRISVKLRQRTSQGVATYEIVDGRHRIAALKALGEEFVRAEVDPIGRGGYSAQDRAKETLVANIQRERNLCAEADAVGKLLESGHTPQTISEETGINLRVVKELATFKNALIAEAYEALRSGGLARGAAKAMLRLDPSRQKALLEGADEETPVRVADAHGAVRDQRLDMLDQLTQVTTPTIAPDHAQLSSALQHVAGQYVGPKQVVLLQAAQILLGGDVE